MPAWILYALASMFFAGLTSVIAKFGLNNVPSDLGLAIRTTMVFVLIWINAIAFKHVQQMGSFTKKDIVFLCISGLTTTLSWIFYYRAIKIGDVSVVASIDKASLVITIILAFFFLKEPITPKVLLGAGLITAGTLVLVFK
ncbi:MAG: EamA family transporter [Burkholderiales bacterium]|nr:EamA family transporter [Bacteroidia bacterium]